MFFESPKNQLGSYRFALWCIVTLPIFRPKIGGGGVTLPIWAVIKLDWAVLKMNPKYE